MRRDGVDEIEKLLPFREWCRPDRLSQISRSCRLHPTPTPELESEAVFNQQHCRCRIEICDGENFHLVSSTAAAEGPKKTLSCLTERLLSRPIHRRTVDRLVVRSQLLLGSASTPGRRRKKERSRRGLGREPRPSPTPPFSFPSVQSLQSWWSIATGTRQ